MKKLQLVTKILVVVLITAVAFVGIYVQKQNRMENIVKDYDMGMDLAGGRVVELKVSDEKKEITKDKDGNIVEEADKEEGGDYTTEEKPVNADEVKTSENYNKSKEIIEKRLEKLGINEYSIKLDEESGKMIIQIPEDDDTDHTVSNFSEVGKFEIVDSEDTENILMDNSDIKESNVMYNTTTDGTTVYLNIEFNKDGAEKLKNISTEYATVEDNKDEESETAKEGESAQKTEEGATEAAESTDENSEKDSETKQKEIIMQIDGNKMITTSFDQTMENGSIQLSMGQATTDKDKINDSVESATTIATLLDTGNLPVEYENEENEFTASDITSDLLIKIAIAEAIVAAIALIFLIIKYRKIGLLAAISYIGFVSLYLLLIRYTNVVLTLEGIAAIAVVFTLNYIFNYKLLQKVKEQEEDEKSQAVKKAFISFWIKSIPICILSIVFCFINWIPISSFGMTMFWGLLLIALYNITLTRSFLK